MGEYGAFSRILSFDQSPRRRCARAVATDGRLQGIKARGRCGWSDFMTVGGVLICENCFGDEGMHVSAYYTAAAFFEHGARTRCQQLIFQSATAERVPESSSDPAG